MPSRQRKVAMGMETTGSQWSRLRAVSGSVLWCRTVAMCGPTPISNRLRVDSAPTQ